LKINKRLNVVIPIERAEGGEAYVHCTPISAEVFNLYWEPLSLTFTRIYAGGHGILSGPRIADRMLKKVAQELDVWGGEAGVERGLLNEIRQRANLLVCGEKGWELLPFADAVRSRKLEGEDAEEVEAAITFFTVVSCMHRRNQQHEILDGAMKLWGARVEPLSCTEFLSSLRTSMPDGSSGARPEG